MDCPICGGYLINEGAWGYLPLHQSGEILGHTYKCPNHEGFETESSANNYLIRNDQTFESIGVSGLEEVTCGSSIHNVSGSFYTDKSGELHSGYPC